MATIIQFEELEIWKLTRELANDIFNCYSKSQAFSKDFKLLGQLNGSSGSIMDNIAEGFERDGRNEFVNFLSIAKGSTGEVKSQLYGALDRKYLSLEEFRFLYNKAHTLGRKMGAFIKYLKQSEFKGNKFKNRR